MSKTSMREAKAALDASNFKSVLAICKQAFALGESSGDIRSDAHKPVFYNLYVMAAFACDRLELFDSAEQAYRKAIKLDAANTQVFPRVISKHLPPKQPSGLVRVAVVLEDSFFLSGVARLV